MLSRHTISRPHWTGWQPGGSNRRHSIKLSALVKRLFSFSIHQGVLNGSNPASRIKLKFDNRMYDQLDAEGVRRLLTVLDADPNRRACLVLKFLLAAGRRKSEVLSLTWVTRYPSIKNTGGMESYSKAGTSRFCARRISTSKSLSVIFTSIRCAPGW